MYSRNVRQSQNRGESVHAALTGFNAKSGQGHHADDASAPHPSSSSARGPVRSSNSIATEQHNNYTQYAVNPAPEPAHRWPSHEDSMSQAQRHRQTQPQPAAYHHHEAPQAVHSTPGAAAAPPRQDEALGGGPTLVRHYANAGMVHQPDTMQAAPSADPAGGGQHSQGGVPFLPGFSGEGGRESFGINAVSHRGRPAVTPGTLPSTHDKLARGWIRYHLPDEHRPGIRPSHTSIDLQRTTAGTMAVFGGATSPPPRPGTAPAVGGVRAPNPGRKLQSSDQTASALQWGDSPSIGAPVEALHDDIGTAVRPRRSYVQKNLTSSHVANSLRFDGGGGGAWPSEDGYDPEHSVRPRTAFVARTQRSVGVQSALTGRGDDASAGAYHGCAPVSASAQQVKGMMGGHGKRIQHYEKVQRSAEGILQRDGNRYFESTQAAMHTGASEGGPRARTPPRRGRRPATQGGANNPYRQTWVFG